MCTALTIGRRFNAACHNIAYRDCMGRPGPIPAPIFDALIFFAVMANSGLGYSGNRDSIILRLPAPTTI